VTHRRAELPIPLVMNDSPKKVARHSLLAINCRKTKGIKTDCLAFGKLCDAAGNIAKYGESGYRESERTVM